MAGTSKPRDGRHRILVVQHRRVMVDFYRILLDWVALNLPHWRDCFDVQTLGADLHPQPHHSAMVGWLQDPVQAWSQKAFDNAQRLTLECEERGMAIVNRVGNLDRAGKFDGARVMRSVGLATPGMVLILDTARFRQNMRGLKLPIFVREDWMHGSRMLAARTMDEVRALPLESFRRPVGVEIVLLPDAQDGMFRKYRYIVAGERGAPHHVQVSKGWITRGEHRVTNDRTKREELDYIAAPCPHHDFFVRATQAMGLDLVAFDYGLVNGQPIVWEANPFPHLKFSRTTLVYRNESMHRTMAMMAALYFERAGLGLPPEIEEYFGGDCAVLPAGGLPPSGRQWELPPEPKAVDQPATAATAA